MIPKHKGEIPVVILLIPFICGIAFGYNFLPHITTIGLITALGFLSTVFVILNRFYFRLLKIRWLSGLTIHLILFFFGWALVTRHDERKVPDHFSKAKAHSFIATLTTDPVLKNGYYHFTAAINASADSGKISAASGNLLVLLKDSSAGKLKYGDRLLIPAKYAAVQPPLNPAEFNYKAYLAQQNIHFEAFLFSKQYRVIDSNKGNSPIATALKLRKQMILKLKKQMHDTRL
jgi:competence protein ComEC